MLDGLSRVYNDGHGSELRLLVLALHDGERTLTAWKLDKYIPLMIASFYREVHWHGNGLLFTIHSLIPGSQSQQLFEDV